MLSFVDSSRQLCVAIVSAITIRRAVITSAAASAVGLVSACQPPASADVGDTDGDEDVAAPVVVVKVKTGTIEATIEAASTIEPERQVTVHAESTGRISLLEIEEGDLIDSGKLIAKIKQDIQRSGLDRAKTNLSKVKEDLKVVERLHQAGAASSEELRVAEIAYDTAKLDVRDRKRDVASTRVTAPMTGTVTERFVNVGGYVATGAQLVTIIDFASLVARVYVPERELDRIEVGQPAQIVGKAATARRGVGKVLRVAPVVDATTGTVKVTIALPEALAGGAQGFLPGMYAEVTLVTQRRESAVLVDKQALVYRDEQPFAFVVEGDHVKEHALKIGLTDSDHAEVLDGLSVGDAVVRSGQAGLEDGGLIRLVDATGKPIADAANADPTPDGAVADAAAPTADSSTPTPTATDEEP